MKNTTFYRCNTSTEATDKANIFYINSQTARAIQKDPQKKQITVTGRNNYILAIFAY